MTPSKTKLVAYYRVSTARQGKSGLGLEAQEAAVSSYACGIGGKLLASYTEVESGKRDENRPQLQAAMKRCRATNSRLVIAKLDRLSRNAAFLLSLRDSGVHFVAADMPDANNLTVGILAVVAEAEREAISTRTKEALKAVKARGVKLGNPNGAAPLRRAGKGNKAAVVALRAKAANHAEMMREGVEAARESGASTLAEVASFLNSEGFTTSRGGVWHPSTVRSLLQRLK